MKENRNTFKIKTGYFLERLTPEAIKLLGSTKNKINKDKNGKYVPHLEITEVVLIILLFSTTIISKVQESCIHLFVINHLVNY